MKAVVYSPESDINFFDVVTGVLLGNMRAQYTFIICLDYVVRMLIDLIKGNSFKLKKKRQEAEDISKP